VTNVSERLIRGVGVVSVIAFIVITLTPAMNIVGRRIALTSSQLQQADAIVVLGAGYMPKGGLNSESMSRLIAGIKLFKKGMAPLLVVSGPGRGNTDLTEGRVRAKLAREMGIPPAAILLEDTANTTREESMDISQTLHARNATRILLVTDSLHMRRARLVFERAGLQVQPAASSNYPDVLGSPADRLLLTLWIVRETGGLIYYHLAGYI
jgi:uncharacterized SAM-binding protein YcdF (DUF218 family)